MTNKITNVILKKKGDCGVDMPRVSVILPVHNAGRRLEGCMQALTGQSLSEIELICVNDGSTDHSLDELMLWADKDHRITVLTQENRGACSARNHGVEIASGEYLYFADAQTCLTAEALEALYHDAKRGQLDVLFFENGESPEPVETSEPAEVSEASEPSEPEPAELLPSEEGWALFARLMHQGQYRECVHQQLIRREHYQAEYLHFNEEVVGEDHLFTFHSMTSAKRAALVEKACFAPYTVPEEPESFVEEFGMQEPSEDPEGTSAEEVLQAMSQNYFSEVYNLLRSSMELDRILGNLHREPDEEDALITLTDLFLEQARDQYHELGEDGRAEAAKLTGKERHFFRMMIGDGEDALCQLEEMQGALTADNQSLKEELEQLKKEFEAEKAAYAEERRHARSEIESQRGELRHLAAELRASSLEKQLLRDHCAELEAGRGSAVGLKNGKKNSDKKNPTDRNGGSDREDDPDLTGIEIAEINEYDLVPGQYAGSNRDNWRANSHPAEETARENDSEEEESRETEDDKAARGKRKRVLTRMLGSRSVLSKARKNKRRKSE